jgi:hypothetical protein
MFKAYLHTLSFVNKTLARESLTLTPCVARQQKRLILWLTHCSRSQGNTEMERLNVNGLLVEVPCTAKKKFKMPCENNCTACSLFNQCSLLQESQRLNAQLLK